MPIFEYDCSSCGIRFELLVRSNSDKVSCPKCGNKSVKKLFSSFGFRAKGGDFSSASVRGSPSCASCSTSTCSTCKQ